MKRYSYKAKVIIALAAVLAALALVAGGCAGESKPEFTEVSLKILRPGSGLPGGEGVSSKIDPDAHPVVAVTVQVTAPDMNAPMLYNFTPAQVSGNEGVLKMDVPSGKARLFTPVALEFDPASTTTNVFPGTLYRPLTPPAGRTADLTGDPVTLDIDITASSTASVAGVIRDDIEGTLSPIDGNCYPSSLFTGIRFRSPLIGQATAPVSVSVDAAGNYGISGVPRGLAFAMLARDEITGATGSASINIPPGSASVTADLNLTGANQLTVTPQSATVVAGNSLTLTADGGMPPYSISFSANNSGANLTPTGSVSSLYTAGSPPSTVASVADTITVDDACGHSATSTITVTWPPLVISPANPSIGPGQDIILSASGGNGNYSWSIVTQGCAGSSLIPSGTVSSSATYNSGGSANCSDVVRLDDTAGTTPATVTVTIAPFGVGLGTVTFTTESQLGLQVNAALPAAGHTVRFEVVHDDNGNGAADAGEPAVKIFDVADGQGPDAYPRVPYDGDAATDGSITTSLPYYDPPHAAGSYILKATDLTTGDTAENAFTITPVVKATYISGTVTDGTNPLPGALVGLLYGTDGDPQEWSWTDNNGNFEMYSEHTENEARVFALKDGYLWDALDNSPLDMAAVPPSIIVTLSPSDGTVISGTLTGESGGEPIPGVMAVVVSEEPFEDLRYVAGDVTDASGAFSFDIISGQSWWANVLPSSLVEHGYMLNEEGGIFCNVSSSITGVNGTFVKADGYVTGMVPGAPAGMRVDAFPESGELEEEEMYSVSTVDPGSNYYLPIKTGYDYWVSLHPEDLGKNDVLALEGFVQASTGGSPYTHDFTLEAPTAHISGTFTVNAANTGAPVGGVTVFADSDAGYNVEASTDAAGNFTVPVNDGTWYLEPEESPELMRMGYTDTFEGQLVYSISGASSIYTGADFTVNDSGASAVISGTIREEATGSILEDAWVIIDKWTGSDFEVVHETDALCGEYAVRLPTGEYKVSAYHDLYVNEYYPDSYDINAADSIFVGPPGGDYNPQVLDFYLNEGGSITGDVISWGPAVGGGFGQPLPYVEVEARGINPPYNTGWGEGDANGSFTAHGLLTNDYEVLVSKEGFQSTSYYDAVANPFDPYTPVPVISPNNTDLNALSPADVLLEPTMCNNGMDDDEDGFIDMSDPGCDGIWDWDEENWSVECDDGVDNDGDTHVDYGPEPLANDPGCLSPADSTERASSLACDDGIDNDGDTYIDWPADPGCTSIYLSDSTERDGDGLGAVKGYICDDGIDNDGDTFTDYLNDPDCADIFDLEEPAGTTNLCGNTADDDGDTLADMSDPACSINGYDERDPSLVCDDGIDNDGDGYVDSFDPGCASPSDMTETSNTLECDNGVDDDVDGYTDWPNDPGCDRINDPTGEVGSYACNDGVDNDLDGFTDWLNDDGCMWNPWRSTETHAQYPCDDGVDNDGDTLTDMADPQCQMVGDPWMCMLPGNELAGCAGAF